MDSVIFILFEMETRYKFEPSNISIFVLAFAVAWLFMTMTIYRLVFTEWDQATFYTQLYCASREWVT